MKTIKFLTILTGAFCLLFLFACSGSGNGNGGNTPNHTVYFATADISCPDCEPRTVESGTTITLPTPTKSGFAFNGWHNEDYSVRYGGGGDNFKVTKDVDMFPEFQD